MGVKLTKQTKKNNNGESDSIGRRSWIHLLCLTWRYYLLEPEGEPAIAPEREWEKGEEYKICLFIHSLCLKTWLLFIRLTQMAETSQFRPSLLPGLNSARLQTLTIWGARHTPTLLHLNPNLLPVLKNVHDLICSMHNTICGDQNVKWAPAILCSNLQTFYFLNSTNEIQ